MRQSGLSPDQKQIKRTPRVEEKCTAGARPSH